MCFYNLLSCNQNKFHVSHCDKCIEYKYTYYCAIRTLFYHTPRFLKLSYQIKQTVCIDHKQMKTNTSPPINDRLLPYCNNHAFISKVSMSIETNQTCNISVNGCPNPHSITSTSIKNLQKQTDNKNK